MTRERQVDKVEVCGEPDFICIQTMWSMNMTPYFLFVGVTQEPRCYVYVLPGTQRH